jgi:uncharacterized membrane protein
MFPDWIPNIHPFVVHFPVALIIIAVAADIVRVFIQKIDWLNKTTLFLYITGTLGLIAAYFSGQQAVDSVHITGNAIPVVTNHEDWALYTTIFFIIYTIVRTVTYIQNREQKIGFRVFMALFAIIGGGMLWYTGEQGAKLVYKHGVAVGEIDRMSQQIEGLEQQIAMFREEVGPEIREDGSWIWRIGAGAGEALAEYFDIDGDSDIATDTGREDARSHLELPAPTEMTFIHTGGTLHTIDGRIEVNLTDFNGEFKLVHHFIDRENYQYIRMNGGELSQGQIINGTDNVLGSGSIESDGWHTFRVTASGRHFYGYQNGNTIVHTHADEMEPGTTGFALSGEGTVKVRLVEFGSVD